MQLKDKFKSYEQLAAENEAREKEKQRRELQKRAERLVQEKMVEQFLTSSELTEKQKDDYLAMYDPWKPGKKYGIGDHVQHEGSAYVTIQPHTSQEDWQPQNVPALFKIIYQTAATDPDTGEEQEVVPDFVQPTGAHNTYNKGDRVLFNGIIYESTADGNAYSPEAYPPYWNEIGTP